MVYGLASQNEIRYVGKTSGPLEDRLKRHLRTARSGASWHSARWIRSVGYAIEIIPLEKDPVGGLDESERSWIATLRSYGCRLTNMTDGGDGQSPGYSPSRSARKKMSDAGLRRYADPVLGPLGREASAAGGRLLRGFTRSPENRVKIADTLRGRKNGPPSEATRDAIGRANTGTKCSCRANRQCAFCRRGGDVRA